MLNSAPLNGLTALGLALGVAGWLAGLAGCAPTELAVDTAKQVQQTPGAMPRTEYGGYYKVGKPYQVSGKWYYPAVDYALDETGIASWYGPKFHGKTTANDEIFNQWALTAAHRTLPMPSFVRVTNLENGRGLVLRINDRGPFARDRIIDVSRRAAQLLGFERQGTARVRVQIIPELSRQAASRAQGGIGVAADDATPVAGPITARRDLSKPNVNRQALAPPDVPAAAVAPSLAAAQPMAVSGLFVQAGSYSLYENARRAHDLLMDLGPVEVSQVVVRGRDWYRVRLGPYATAGEGRRILQQVQRFGFGDARLIGR